MMRQQVIKVVIRFIEINLEKDMESTSDQPQLFKQYVVYLILLDIFFNKKVLCLTILIQNLKES